MKFEKKFKGCTGNLTLHFFLTQIFLQVFASVKHFLNIQNNHPKKTLIERNQEIPSAPKKHTGTGITPLFFMHASQSISHIFTQFFPSFFPFQGQVFPSGFKQRGVNTIQQIGVHSVHAMHRKKYPKNSLRVRMLKKFISTVYPGLVQHSAAYGAQVGNVFCHRGNGLLCFYIRHPKKKKKAS
jgi:hypothetical protein